MAFKGKYKLEVTENSIELKYDALSNEKRKELFYDYHYNQNIHRIHKILVLPSIDFGTDGTLDQDTLDNLIDNPDELNNRIEELKKRNSAKGKNGKFSFEKTTGIDVNIRHDYDDIMFRGIYPRSKVIDERGIPLDLEGEAKSSIFNIKIKTVLNAFKKEKVQIVGACMEKRLKWVLYNKFKFKEHFLAGFELYFVYEELAENHQLRGHRTVNIELIPYRGRGTKVVHSVCNRKIIKLVTKPS